MNHVKLVTREIEINRNESDFEPMVADVSAIVGVENGTIYVKSFASSTPLTPAEIVKATDELVDHYRAFRHALPDESWPKSMSAQGRELFDIASSAFRKNGV